MDLETLEKKVALSIAARHKVTLVLFQLQVLNQKERQNHMQHMMQAQQQDALAPPRMEQNAEQPNMIPMFSEFDPKLPEETSTATKMVGNKEYNGRLWLPYLDCVGTNCTAALSHRFRFRQCA